MWTLTRKCKNWLLTFRDWSLPRCEAKETYVFWTGLYTLASVMRRRVVVPRALMGSWEIPPNLYVIFVSPAGKGRKTTTMGFADELLEDIPGVLHSSTVMTSPVLIKKLSETDDSSMSIRCSEFAVFIDKAGVEMFNVLTDLYDGKRTISSDTIVRGFEFAVRPCVNLFAATVPEWISEGMPESVIGGGFASRAIFIYEETVRRRQMYYESLDYKELDKIKADLREDLVHLASNIQGNFKIEADAKLWMEGWYRQNADKTPLNDHRTHSYFERKPAHIHKLAMLLHLAYSDELIITQEDFEQALYVLEQIEKNLMRVFQNVGKNPFSLEMERIRDFIKEKRKVERKEVLARFYRVAEPAKLIDLLQGLVAAEEIDTFIEGNTQYYRPHMNSKTSSPALPRHVDKSETGRPTRTSQSEAEDLEQLRQLARGYAPDSQDQPPQPSPPSPENQ